MRPLLPMLLFAAALAACGDADDPTVDPAPVTAGGTTPPRTVVLISLDTLRPDRLGCYGGTPDVSPVLDALAAESVVFDQALAPSPWTLPSHMTMLTGLDPFAHGMSVSTRELNPAVTTLSESLAEAGYETGAFTDGGYVRASYGFGQGFDVFDDERHADDSGLPNGFPRLMPRALDWLGERDDDSRVFLFLHTFDAHTPYDEVEPGLLERFRDRPVADDARDPAMHWLSHMHKQAHVGVTDYAVMGELLNDYDAGIHEADLYLGRLFDLLRAQGRWDDALILVTSDHGESFFDHGLHVGHGMRLTDNELRVPLIVKLPGGRGAGQRHDALVGLVDLYRTVAEATGAAVPDEVQGESLLGLVEGRPRTVDHVVTHNFNIRAFGLVKGSVKYTTSVGIPPMVIGRNHLGPTTPPAFDPPDEEAEYEFDGRSLAYDEVRDPLALREVLPATQQLYDRDADPGERHNLVDEKPGLLRAMYDETLRLMAASEKIHGRHPALNAKEDKAQERNLRALGYMHGTGDDSDLDPAAAMRGVPPQQRIWTTQRIVPPEQARIAEADRRVHRVRVRAGRGEDLGPEDHQALQSAGTLYMEWLADHPEHVARIDWRLFELDRLSRGAGFQLADLSAWLLTLRELR